MPSGDGIMTMEKEPVGGGGEPDEPPPQLDSSATLAIAINSNRRLFGNWFIPKEKQLIVRKGNFQSSNTV